MWSLSPGWINHHGLKGSVKLYKNVFSENDFHHSVYPQYKGNAVRPKHAGHYAQSSVWFQVLFPD